MFLTILHFRPRYVHSCISSVSMVMFLYTYFYIGFDMTSPNDLPSDEQDFIVERAVEGYEPELIHYELEKAPSDKYVTLTLDTVRRFIESDYGQEMIDLERRVQEKKAEVSREELIRDLKEQKRILMERSKQLRDNDLDEINNDTVSTILKSVRMLGEFIDELQSKDTGVPGTVNINKLDIDLTQNVRYLSRDEKLDVVEALENDDSIKDFAVIKKKE